MTQSADYELSSISARDLSRTLLSRWLALPDEVGAIRQSTQTLAAQLDELHHAQVAPAKPGLAETRSPDSMPATGELLVAMHQCLERLATEQTQLQEQHYQEHIIAPLTQRLATIYDLAVDAKRDVQGSEQAANQLCDVLSAIASKTLELLACYGVRPLDSPAGHMFDSRTMSAPIAPPNDGAEGEWQVVESIRIGFVNNGGRVLRPQIVNVKKTVQIGCAESC